MFERVTQYLMAPDEDGGGATDTPTEPVAQEQDKGASPPADVGGGASDFEARYKEAQAWGTRSSQEAAQLREQVGAYQALLSGDPEQQQAAANYFGIDLDDFDDDDSYDEDEGGQYAELDPRTQAQLDRALSYQQDQEYQREEAKNYQILKADSEPTMQRLRVPEGMREDVLGFAVYGLDPVQNSQGGLVPDIEGAYEYLVDIGRKVAEVPEIQQHSLQLYKQSKRAPHFSPSGASGVQQPDMSDTASRQAWMVERLRAEEL